MSHKQQETPTPLWVRGLTGISGTIGLGFVNWAFDYPFYAYMTELFTSDRFGLTLYDGALLTFGVMSILSWLLSFSFIKYYDYTEKDWLGLEALKVIRENADPKSSWCSRIASLGDVAAFLIFAIYDPVYSTIFLRKGSEKYNGFSRRDWVIFNLSVLYSNALWTSGWLATIEFIRFVPWLIERYAT
ncbi:MAG: hypothetical protein RLZZ234_138 [Candidatus Parcubacteria bacterium]